MRAVPDDAWSGRFERTPDGPTFPLDAVPLMRVREIEIHHADLGLGYTADDWPHSFAEVVVDGMVRRLEPEPGFRVTPLDSERTWDVGDGQRRRAGRHRPGRPPGLVADRPAAERAGHQQPRRAAHDRGLVMAYTGDVTPRGLADVRELEHLTITKYAVDPEMANNCYLLQCRTRRQRLKRAATAAMPLLALCG